MSYLRPRNQDQAKHTWAILSLLVKRLRKEWPEVKIIFRGDGGFCRHKMFSWCERYDVKYIVGIAKNNRLLNQSKELQNQAEKNYEETKEKQRLFSDIIYAAEILSKKRRIIVKAEFTSKGDNTRFVVTSLSGDAQHLYDNVYCTLSIIETCKHHKVEPYDYLRYALNALPQCQTIDDYEKLLPYNIDRSLLVASVS